jgi:putative DNA methylase
MSEYKKKLIEVALPLEAINRESAREKSIRHGHPSTLHLWWARRPLAACRAVLFSQLVDDPSAHPDQFPTEEDQAVERQRLFNIIERLVVWENINDEALLREAHEEILRSTDGNPPAILDPFAGGGSIPLEAQRLGLKAYASDLNPVAVLINKALIEIPPKWAGQPPVFPGAAEAKMIWPKATGLAEDVRRYGQWMRDEAERRIGHLYPKATLADGTEAKVIAWIWARTVICPNPACATRMPLVRSWWLGKKKGKEAYVVPRINREVSGQAMVEFDIGHDRNMGPSGDVDGTVGRNGATCVACGTAVPLSYVRDEGKGGRIGVQLMAVVAEGNRRRTYLPPDAFHESASIVPRPEGSPESALPEAALGFRVQGYGMRGFEDLFTDRQLTFLTTLTDLVGEARERAVRDAELAGLTCPEQRADAVALYLGLSVARTVDYASNLTTWASNPQMEILRNVFGRQAVPMVWDFAEGNPFGPSSGSLSIMLTAVTRVLDSLGEGFQANVEQADAAMRTYEGVVVSTDPPYYDNIGYANLSDFFYVWLRRALRDYYPDLLGTIQTPKAEELVAEPFRHGGADAAKEFFEQGFRDVFSHIRRDAVLDFPTTVFYAFKQSDDNAEGTASTGWQTLLEGLVHGGWEVTATWPVRSESSGRMLSNGTNALASSVVLALRPRMDPAQTVNRRTFIAILKQELPEAMRSLQQGSIAPVDLAQAAVGPGMAVFSRHAKVLEADGSDMTVRTALALINQMLDEVLAKQEGDFDAETRFAVKWFSQHGWTESVSGEADVLTRALNTTVAMLERGGIFRAAAGKARLLKPSEMSKGWNPSEDKAISVWEVAVRLGNALVTEGADQASAWMREASSRVDLNAVKELSYLMYSVSEKKGWTESAMLFNALGTSWSEVAGAARAAPAYVPKQSSLDFGDDDE